MVDVRVWEAVLKAFYGTDTRCDADRIQGERMISEAEAKIATLQRTLDDRPPHNLDEAVYGLTRRREG